MRGLNKAPKCLPFLRNNMTPQDVFEKLKKKALTRNIIGWPDKDRLKYCIEHNEPIPEICLPGSLLNDLTDEERKILSKLKQEDIWLA